MGKETVSFVMFACLSARLHQGESHHTDFCEI